MKFIIAAAGTILDSFLVLCASLVEAAVGLQAERGARYFLI